MSNKLSKPMRKRLKRMRLRAARLKVSPRSLVAAEMLRACRSSQMHDRRAARGGAGSDEFIDDVVDDVDDEG